ncbi:hypothetical protein FBY13_103267 [Pantoea sp. SJZ147]|nr:hypothetical protein FBY13_103267 [Pantoea sp. SJZ147]
MAPAGYVIPGISRLPTGRIDVLLKAETFIFKRSPNDIVLTS